MSKNRMSVSYSDSYEMVTFKVLNEANQVLATREYLVNDLPEDNSAHSHAYGVNKLLTDRTSEFKDKLAKLEAMDEVWSFLMSGEWAKERQVGAIVVSPEVEGLAKLQGLSIPDVQAALAAYDKDTRKAILGNEKVVAAAKLIREARIDRPTATLDEFVS